MTTSSSNAAVSVAAQTVSRDINNTSGARAIIAVDKLAAKVRFYDAVSHAEIKAIDTAKFPHELAISPDHRFACVSIYGMGIFGNNPEPGKSIEVYDLESMQRTSTISVEPFFAPHGMMFDASGKLWVGCDAAAKLLCIDAASGKIEAAWDTGSTGSHFISMTPDAAKIYVSNKGDDLGVFDVLQRKFTTTLTLPHGSEGITASPDGRHVGIDLLLGRRRQRPSGCPRAARRRAALAPETQPADAAALFARRTFFDRHQLRLGHRACDGHRQPAQADGDDPRQGSDGIGVCAG